MLNRRELLELGVGLGLAAAAPGCTRYRRPNVIYMITDDQRWDLMSCAGHPVLRTPHMDRIAAEGARFTNVFVTSSLCSPARGSFLSGLYPHQHGVISNANNRIERFYREVWSFPRLLKEAGYSTAYIGKFHIGRAGKPRPGFDHWAVLPWQGLYVNPRYNINGEERYLEGWVDDLTGDFAADWLGQAREPFCLCVGFKSPHAQQIPPERYKDLYADAEVIRPGSYEEDYRLTGKPNVVAESVLRVSRFFDGPRRKGGWEPWVKDFYRCLVGVDDNVGKILGALDARGLAEDTVVVFASDNGFFLGEHGLADKRFPYEEGLRVPLLIRYPRRVPPGITPPQTALNIDLAPTLLGWCGVAPRPECEGEDLAGLIAEPGAPGRDWFVYEYDDPAFSAVQQGFQFPHILAVRTRRYKLIEHLESIADRSELYDLEGDGEELRNRIDDPAMAGVLRDLRGKLARWKRETGWQPPVPVTRWRALAPGPQGPPFDKLGSPAPPADDAPWELLEVDAEGGLTLRAERPVERWLAADIRCADARCGAVLHYGCTGVFTLRCRGRRLRWTERPTREFFSRLYASDLPLEEGPNRVYLLVRYGPEPARVAATVQTVGWRGRRGPLVSIL